MKRRLRVSCLVSGCWFVGSRSPWIIPAGPLQMSQAPQDITKNTRSLHVGKWIKLLLITDRGDKSNPAHLAGGIYLWTGEQPSESTTVLAGLSLIITAV